MNPAQNRRRSVGLAAVALTLSGCAPYGHDDPTADAVWQVEPETDAPERHSFPIVHADAMWFSGGDSELAVWYEPSTGESRYETSDEGLPRQAIWEHDEDIWSIRVGGDQTATLVAVDRSTDEELTRIPLGVTLTNPALLVEGSEAWVAAPSTGEVLVINLSSRVVSDRIDVGIATQRLERHDTTLWAMDNNSVVVIDIELREADKALQLPTLFGTAIEHAGIYWSTYGAGEFIKLSTGLGEEPTSLIELDGDGRVMRVTDDLVWVAFPHEESLSVFDAHSHEELETFRLGFPASTVEEFRGSVFVTGRDRGVVAVFDAVSYEMTDYVDFNISWGTGDSINGPLQTDEGIWFYEKEDGDLTLLTRTTPG